MRSDVRAATGAANKDDDSRAASTRTRSNGGLRRANGKDNRSNGAGNRPSGSSRRSSWTFPRWLLAKCSLAAAGAEQADAASVTTLPVAVVSPPSLQVVRGAGVAYALQLRRVQLVRGRVGPSAVPLYAALVGRPTFGLLRPCLTPVRRRCGQAWPTRLAPP